MSSFAVTAERLIIVEHPNADALELAQVGGYRAVVAKGAYRTGDLAVYIPEQAIVPASLIAELGLTGRLAGKEKDRVKAVRLRGELSQGIVCSPASLADHDLDVAEAARTDFADLLGVTKWVPEIPLSMSGVVEAAPDLLGWVDIENIKRSPDVFAPGEDVVATEKVHGTCCLVTYDARQDRLWVSSKGFGARHQALVANDTNLYWRAVRTHGVDRLARELCQELGVGSIGVFGEVYGAGVQDLDYGLAKGAPGYACFDICLGDSPTRWLAPHELVSAVASRVGLATRLYDGPYDVTVLTTLAEGTETISGATAHLREGLVVRPRQERHSDVTGGRAIAKFVSEAYLTRKGATEFE